MAKVVIIGGGFSGCAAAAAAAKAGVNVTLLERMDILSGFGPCTGRMDLRYLPVSEELRLMGSNDVFDVIENCAIHPCVKFPFPKPGNTQLLFDTDRIDIELMKRLQEIGVDVRLQSRAIDVVMTDETIKSVVLDNGDKIDGDVFLDATGGAGPESNCRKYGDGCAMCIMRCPAFGGRVSIAAKAGVKELMGKRRGGTIGPLISAYGAFKESLTPKLREEIETNGMAMVPLPPELVDYTANRSISASYNIDDGFAENAILADIGAYVKRIAGGRITLAKLRKIPGFENARFAEPFAGSVGNGVRYMAITPRSDALGVPSVDNLFVASEKLGNVGIPGVIITGTIAGYNAARKAKGMEPLVLPTSIMAGKYIAFINEGWDTEERLRERYNFHRALGIREASPGKLSEQDKDEVRERIETHGLLGIITNT